MTTYIFTILYIKTFLFLTFLLDAGSSDKSISFVSPSSVRYHSGNLIVPIGSNKIHCDPPKEYEPQKGKIVQTIFIYIFILNVIIVWFWAFVMFCVGLNRAGQTTKRVQTCMKRVFAHTMFIIIIIVYVFTYLTYNHHIFWIIWQKRS